MINQPEIQEPNPQQEKLVLPPPDGNESSTPGGSLHYTQVRPEDLIRPAAMPPKDPLARLIYFWSKDPAYKVLIIAVGLVLIAGLLFFSLVSRAMNPNLFKLNSTSPQAPPTGVTPSGTVDLRPAFPSPGGGQGSSTSSQPPAQSTPALQPTVDNTQSSPTPGQGGTLTVQITGIPNRVQNGSVVDVGVRTNEANVTVELYVVYSAPPYRDFAGPHMTDDGGNATIPWSVSVYKIGGARATVVAIARDQNGQQAQSQPVSVQIAGFGGG